MRCRKELLVRWPYDLLQPLGALTPGEACDLYVCGPADDPPVISEFLAALGKGRKVASDANRALAMVMHFTTIPPGRRIPPIGSYAAMGASDVEAECGLREPLWKFGLGKGTRVRIFGANVDDSPRPAIVLLTVTVKSSAEDDWKAVRRGVERIRIGEKR